MTERCKQRSVRRTTLIYGEGSDDKCFLEYLKGLYAREKTIKIKNGGGGSPTSVIEKMTNTVDFGSYDAKIALIDTDRPEFDKAEKLAIERGINIVPSEGCIELEMLKLINIISSGKLSSGALKRAHASSQQAKIEFGKVCKHDTKVYAKLFPKRVLEIARAKSKWLNSLITVLENF